MEMPLLCLLWKEETHNIFLWQKTFSDCINRDFPDHPVVKTAGFLARGKGLIPGWGTMISHAARCGKNKKYQYMSLNSVYCHGSAFWLQLICAKAYREALGYQEHTLEWQRVWVIVGSLHFWRRFLYPQRILTHAYSRVVLRVLEAAVAAKKRFSVYITESQPDLSGKKMAKALCHLNLPVTCGPWCCSWLHHRESGSCHSWCWRSCWKRRNH